MTESIPPPDPTVLLPPLVACLPTAFASHQPPPAVLPLLSPILRQRVQLLSTSTAASSDSWLHLLCWEPSESAKLAEIVQSEVFEPHPSSGEIELGEIGPAQYRRLDEETLHTRLDVEDLKLGVIYVWCQGDQEGGGSGWRVSELKPLESMPERGKYPWVGSATEADEKAKENSQPKILKQLSAIEIAPRKATPQQEEDDDDYWAQYDNTPARTPAPNPNRSPLAYTSSTKETTAADSEAAYFAQYAQVQPEMDNDDPSENREAAGASSLNGNVITESILLQSNKVDETGSTQTSLDDLRGSANHSIVHTRPSSSSSMSVPRLEGSAAAQSHAEVAVQQHISTSLKSLFRLARGAGIDREEFERLIQTELSALSMMTEDD